MFADQWENTIWKCRPDGTDAIRLTSPPMEAYAPHWSGDGTRIAFMGRMPGRHWLAYTIPSAGGRSEVVHEDSNEQGVPTWSPDSRYLVFGDRRDQRATDKMNIHLWDFQTKRLSDLPGSAGRWTARWRPKGRYIAAQSTDWHSLYLFDTRSQTWEFLASFFSTDDLNWSPDCTYLYFVAEMSRAARDYVCYRIRIADRKVEPVFNLRDRPDLDIHMAGIAPDGSPVFNHPTFDEEIYALNIKWP